MTKTTMVMAVMAAVMATGCGPSVKAREALAKQDYKGTLMLISYTRSTAKTSGELVALDKTPANVAQAQEAKAKLAAEEATLQQKRIAWRNLCEACASVSACKEEDDALIADHRSNPLPACR